MLKAANDNGNSEHNMVIRLDGKGKDGEVVVKQPNVNVEINRMDLKGFENENTESLIENIFDNILVEISSPECNGIYLIGKRALDSGEMLNELEVGFDNKSEVVLPLINTLGNLAAYALTKSMESSKEIPKEIHVGVDMTTALPIKEYYNVPGSQEKMESKFKNGIHYVTLILGKTRVMVKIEFKHVLILPEASSVVFGLLEDEEGNPRSGEIFAAYAEKYGKEEVTGDEFDGKKILHVDIGGGTVDLPLTVDNSPHSSYISGYNTIGASHAIKDALLEIQDELGLPNLQVQNVTKFVKDEKESRQRNTSVKYVNKHVVGQAKQILQKVKEELRRAKMEVDVILVYGGGSILMKKWLVEELEVVAKQAEAKLLYIPEEYAILMNVMGLTNVVNNNDLFEYLLELQESKKKKVEEEKVLEEAKA